MKDLRVRKRVKKAPLLITNVCRKGNQQNGLSVWHRLVFYLLVDVAPRRQEEPVDCIARRGRGDAEDIPSSIPEILRDNYFVEGG